MKSNIGASISIETKEKFEKYCSDNSINRSNLIESLIVEFLESERPKKV